LSSFGQLDSNGNEYRLSAPTLDFKNYPVVVNPTSGAKGLEKKNLIKELKCDTLAFAGRKYKGIDEVVKQDIIPIVVAFTVDILGKHVPVTGNSIADEYSAKILLDKAKAGDIVIFSGVLVSIEGKTVSLNRSYVFEIIPPLPSPSIGVKGGSKTRGKSFEIKF